MVAHATLMRLNLVLLLFVSVHIWRVRKDGGVQGPHDPSRDEEERP